MTSKPNVVQLVPEDELRVLERYVLGGSEPADAGDFYDAIEVPDGTEAPRLNIAVAQILLHHIQDELPQWAIGSRDGVLFNRSPHTRHKDARLDFSPQLVCTINWADSGPGMSWPESYYVTYLPAFAKHVVTASRDGDDMWGCSDHAIGFASGELDPVEAAKEAIIEFWRGQFDRWYQSRWDGLFAGGLADDATASAWAVEVWGPAR